VSDDPGRQPRWPPLLKIENSAKNYLKIISSETATQGPFHQSLVQIGSVVLEELIKMQKANDRRTTDTQW
jgi:hypothetical protein